MTSRKEEQGDAAIKQIKEESGHKAKIEWVHCDNGNFNEIKSVFSGIREREQRLDLVRLSLHQARNEREAPINPMSS
jgi:hypothetical protein